MRPSIRGHRVRQLLVPVRHPLNRLVMVTVLTWQPVEVRLHLLVGVEVMMRTTDEAVQFTVVRHGTYLTVARRMQQAAVAEERHRHRRRRRRR